MLRICRATLRPNLTHANREFRGRPIHNYRNRDMSCRGGRVVCEGEILDPCQTQARQRTGRGAAQAVVPAATDQGGETVQRRRAVIGPADLAAAQSARCPPVLVREACEGRNNGLTQNRSLGRIAAIKYVVHRCRLSVYRQRGAGSPRRGEKESDTKKVLDTDRLRVCVGLSIDMGRGSVSWNKRFITFRRSPRGAYLPALDPAARLVRFAAATRGSRRATRAHGRFRRGLSRRGCLA